VYADDLIFTVDDCSNSVYESNATSILIYPNPSTGNIRMEWSTPIQTGEVVLYDMQGRVADRTRFNDSSSLTWIPKVAAGVYQVVIDTNQGRHSTRWTKQLN
jgi:hypothetical protein